MEEGWTEFAELMSRVQMERESLGLRPHQECFFRGHADDAYKLIPSLFRQRDKTVEELLKLERRMFFEFRARARQLYGADQSDWDVLFHMQHHGVPTRLLDWTSVFGVALYFALLAPADTKRRPCVWMMNPYALNHATWGYHRLYEARPQPAVACRRLPGHQAADPLAARQDLADGLRLRSVRGVKSIS